MDAIMDLIISTYYTNVYLGLIERDEELEKKYEEIDTNNMFVNNDTTAA